MATVRKGQHVDLATLREGRTLFVHRCIECHTLPVLWHYRTDDWPDIVNSMSHRASLKPAEREAIVAYILAVRSAEAAPAKKQVVRSGDLEFGQNAQ